MINQLFGPSIRHGLPPRGKRELLKGGAADLERCRIVRSVASSCQI